MVKHQAHLWTWPGQTVAAYIVLQFGWVAAFGSITLAAIDGYLVQKVNVAIAEIPVAAAT